MGNDFNAEKAAEEFDALKAEQEIFKQKKAAVDMLRSADKTEKFLQSLEQKLKNIPAVGEKMSHVPILISLIRSYIRKEYTGTSWVSILITLSSLIYIFTPVDAIPDLIPVFGFFDDIVVLTVCMTYVETEVKAYVEWRKENGLEETETMAICKATAQTSFFN